MKIKALLISEETTSIDFNEIRKNNINMIFIRLGYTSYGKNKEKLIDSKFDINYKSIVKQKIKVGVYYESRAVTKKEAEEEAEYFNQILIDKKLSCPTSVLICDTHSIIIYSDKNQMNLPKNELTNIVLTFCFKMNEYNRDMLIISYKSWFDNNLNDAKIFNHNIAILPNEFNRVESIMYDLYKDNIIYLCDDKVSDNIQIKLESNCIIDKIKSFLYMPIKFIKNKLK